MALGSNFREILVIHAPLFKILILREETTFQASMHYITDFVLRLMIRAMPAARAFRSYYTGLNHIGRYPLQSLLHFWSKDLGSKDGRIKDKRTRIGS